MLFSCLDPLKSEQKQRKINVAAILIVFYNCGINNIIKNIFNNCKFQDASSFT